MLKKTAALIALSLVGTATAYADKGSLNDPSGDDFPDIVKLGYNNADSKVVMKLTYAEVAAQNESFYMRWGSDDEAYQVFVSPSADIEELRYYGKGNGEGKAVKCDGLKIRRPDDHVTKAVIPRSCLDKAPGKLRFQGIATEGLFASDKTKISKAIPRG